MGKKVSIVVPALNEEITIARFVEWCKAGLNDANVEGEILIIDSSTDNTPVIAEKHGANVIRVPKRGLGQAYKDAIPYITGDYVIMGDCDCTYDFRVLRPFIEKLDEGYEFVMGTRMKGTIEKGAMPPLHQYFGTPFTTWILNAIYGSHFSDIHCGMRAMTLEALHKMNLESSSWEYASEMVLKAAKLDLKSTEIPIVFHKDMEGRQSNFIRRGRFESWKAGWINLKVMLLYSPRFFLRIPGTILAAIGLLLTGFLLTGPKVIGGMVLTTHWMLAGMVMVILGVSSIQMSILSDSVYEFNPKQIEKLKAIFPYTRSVIISLFVGLVGLILSIIFLVQYISNGFTIAGNSHISMIGLLLLVVGFQFFTFTLVFNMIVKKNECSRETKAELRREAGAPPSGKMAGERQVSNM